MNNIGEQFHAETKYKNNSMNGGRLNWDLQPKLYKNYPNHHQLKLDAPKNEKSKSIFEVLKKRKSIRFFNNKPLSIDDLSYLLWASTGIQRIEQQWEFRTAPSAGALYPIETYVVVNNIENFENGLYHYSIQNHALDQLKIEELGEKIAITALSQEMVAEAAVIFIWTAIFERSKWKYKQRAYRYVFLDAGHIAAQLSLAAVDLGLGSCQIGAFYDDDLNGILDIDGINESVLYLSAVGNYKNNQR